MGLSKRQQKRLTRRRQKAQRKTNKRRNKNKRGGRKSRVKRQRKRGGAAAEEQGSANNEDSGKPKSKRIKKSNTDTSLHIVRNIHESPIPYYPVLTLFRLLKMSIDHDLLQLQHQMSHGSAIKVKLNSLVNSYIDQQEDIPPFQKKIRDFLMEFLKRALIKDAETHDDTDRHIETLEVMNIIGKLIKFKIKNIKDSVLGMMEYNELLAIFTITDDDLARFTTTSDELVKAQDNYKTRLSGKIIEITNIQAFLHYVGLRFVECLKCTNAVESVEKLVSLVPPAVLHATDVNQLTTYFISEVEEVTKEFHDIMGSLESMMMKALGFILNPISQLKSIANSVGRVVATRVNKAEDELQRQLQQITENDYLTIIQSTIRMMSGSVVPTIPHDQSRRQQLSILEENYKKMPLDVKHAVSFILDRILSNEHVIQDELQKIRDKYPGRSVSQQVNAFRHTLYSPRYTQGQSEEAVMGHNYSIKPMGRNPLSVQIGRSTHPFTVSYPQSQLSERAKALKSNNNNFTF